MNWHRLIEFSKIKTEIVLYEIDYNSLTREMNKGK